MFSEFKTILNLDFIHSLNSPHCVQSCPGLCWTQGEKSTFKGPSATLMAVWTVSGVLDGASALD